MAYMAGNLTRRFRSGHANSRKCPSSQTCIVEVVTSNFHEIVLDETKVGSLRRKGYSTAPFSFSPQGTNVGLESNVTLAAPTY